MGRTAGLRVPSAQCSSADEESANGAAAEAQTGAVVAAAGARGPPRPQREPSALRRERLPCPAQPSAAMRAPPSSEQRRTDDFGPSSSSSFWTPLASQSTGRPELGQLTSGKHAGFGGATEPNAPPARLPILGERASPRASQPSTRVSIQALRPWRPASARGLRSARLPCRE